MVRKKILQLITLSEIGGAQKVVFNLVKGLDKNKYSITVATSCGGELVSWLKTIPEIKVIEIREFVREINIINDLQLFLRLFQLMKKNKYDIVHCHSSKAGLFGRLAAWAAGVPKIIFTVHGWSFDHYLSKILRKALIIVEKLVGKTSDVVVCVSQAVAVSGLKLGILKHRKTSVIFNGIDIDVISRGKLRAEQYMAEDILIVGTVCRMAPPKLPILFLEVARIILERRAELRKKIKFIMIGDGPYYQECRKKVQDMSLEKEVILLGSRENAEEFIADFDVFVLFSESEGLPIVLLEAMKSGKPIIASNVGGIGELVEDNSNGLLTNNNKNEAVMALWKVLVDSKLRQEMGLKSQEKIKKLSVKQMITEYEKIYESLEDGVNSK